MRKPILQGNAHPESGFIFDFLTEMRFCAGITSHGFAENSDWVDVIRKKANASDPMDFDFFMQLECASQEDLLSANPEEANFGALFLMECATFCENIGSPDQAVTLVAQVLSYAEESSNDSLARRSHSYIGALYIRLSDFNNACKHVKHAYNLAKRMNDTLGVFATLANTVAVLESMGLLTSARDLALKLTANQPWGNDKYDFLHLSNASNGLRICHLLEDNPSQTIFFEAGNRAIISGSSFASEITKAHFEAARATYLAKIGKVQEAMCFLDVALAKNSAKDNVRVRSLLICAQAFVHLRTSSYEKIIFSCIEAKKMLEATSKLSDHREELLRVLIKLHAAIHLFNRDQFLSEAIAYLRSLKAHLLTVKHRHFFMAASDSLRKKSPDRQISLQNPFYSVPSWILSLEKTQTSKNVPSINKTPFDIAELYRCSEESRLRTAAFNVAENWAVAAEFANGGDGRQCFNVARIAAAIARQLDFTQVQVAQIELACRLHNIGMIVMSFSELDEAECRTLGTFSLACEHTIVGEKLLLSSDDRTLQLGAEIARTHHEWWNGCGYPVGLRGEDIPLGGRICAVADAFVVLVCSEKIKNAWTIENAVKQVQSMAGMQLDPNLISPFVEALAELQCTTEGLFDSRQTRLEENQLAKARTDLCQVADLVI